MIASPCEEACAAAGLKAAHPLCFTGCSAAATAVREEEAALVTGERGFAKLGRAVEIDWHA